MRILSRLLVVIAVLSGLAMGSYAFGKYVLSSRFLGRTSSGPQLTTSPGADDRVGRTSAVRGDPRVEVDILPADETGDQPDVPSSPSTRRRPNASSDLGLNDGETIIDGDATPTPDTSSEERPRRRRRRKPSEDESKKSEPSPTAKPTADAPARRVSGDDDSTSNSGDSSAPDEPSRDRSEPAPTARPVPVETAPRPDSTPRRRRERVRRSTTQPTKPAPAPQATVRKPARRLDESPIPMPEGGGDTGGSSPVPLPE